MSFHVRLVTGSIGAEITAIDTGVNDGIGFDDWIEA